MRPEVNSNRFEISNRFEKSFCLHGNFTVANLKISNYFQKLFHLHGNFTAATYHTISRFYCTCANDSSSAQLYFFADISCLHVKLTAVWNSTSNWPKQNLFHFAWSYENANNEVVSAKIVLVDPTFKNNLNFNNILKFVLNSTITRIIFIRNK